MAGINVKMGVSGGSQFKTTLAEMKNGVKTLNEALKLNEKQLEATGNKEDYLKNKAGLLQEKLEEQKAIVQACQEALAKMDSQGLSPASKAYQTMQQNMLKAKGEVISTQQEIDGLATSSGTAAENAETMNTELKNIGKGVSWENVTDGIGKVIDKLESGARAAVNLGKKLLQSAKGSTGLADELLTESTKYGIDVETLQRMRNASEFIDTDVDTILNAKARLAKNKESLPELMGFEADGMTVDEAFWKAGEAIMAMTDEFQKEEAAQKVFGRGWKELVPLFTAGQEKYNETLAEQNVMTAEQVEALGKADDAIKKVEQQVELLKNQFWAENADKITEVMQWIVDNKEGVVAALTAIAAAFGAMKIGEFALNLMKVVDGFKQLGLGGAGEKAVEAAASGGGGGGWLAGAAGTAKGLIATNGASLLAPFAAIAAAITPAMIANAADDARVSAKMQGRLGNANLLADSEAKQFLQRSATALGTDWHGGNEQEVTDILMGMGSRGDLEKMKLHNMLNGMYTSQGNSTWNELQRLWSGEGEFDMGRLNSILESVTDAYDKMASQTEQLTGASENQTNSNSEMTQAANNLEGLPEKVAAAVQNAQINVNINPNAFTPYIDRAMGALMAGM